MTNRKIIYKPISPEVAELAAFHGGNKEAVLDLLKDLDSRNQLNASTITDTARALNLSAQQVYGMATFYSMLSLNERKQILRVCDGPVCWLKHSQETNSALKKAPGKNGLWNALPASECVTAPRQFWSATNKPDPFILKMRK